MAIGCHERGRRSATTRRRPPPATYIDRARPTAAGRSPVGGGFCRRHLLGLARGPPGAQPLADRARRVLERALPARLLQPEPDQLARAGRQALLVARVAGEEVVMAVARPRGVFDRERVADQ